MQLSHLLSLKIDVFGQFLHFFTIKKYLVHSKMTTFHMFQGEAYSFAHIQTKSMILQYSNNMLKIFTKTSFYLNCC